jgi:homospermidine synthase
VSEAVHQPSEIGWGPHEKTYPDGAHLPESGLKCSVYLDKLGFAVRHNETISIADYLTLTDDNGNVIEGDQNVFAVEKWKSNQKETFHL